MRSSSSWLGRRTSAGMASTPISESTPSGASAPLPEERSGAPLPDDGNGGGGAAGPRGLGAGGGTLVGPLTGGGVGFGRLNNGEAAASLGAADSGDCAADGGALGG